MLSKLNILLFYFNSKNCNNEILLKFGFQIKSNESYTQMTLK